MNPNLKLALIHVLKVGAFIVGSAVIPALLALYAQNPYWLALTPLFNLAASFLVKWSQLKKAQ